MKILQKIRWMVKKDLLVLWRDKTQIIAYILFPILMITLFGYGMGGNIDNLPIAIYAPDNGQLTNQTLNELKSNELYDIKYITNNSEETKRLVENGTVMSAILLPSNYDDNDDNQSKTVTLYTDSTDYMGGQILIPSTELLFSRISGEIGLSKLFSYQNGQTTSNLSNQNNKSPNNIKSSNVISQMQTIKFQIYKVYGNIEYMDFLVPAVIGLCIMFSCMMRMGESIAGEREKGELTRLFMTPTTVSTVIIGKIVSKLIIETSMAFILLLTAILLFDIKTGNGILGLTYTIILMIIGVLCFVGFGIMISARVHSQKAYIGLMLPITVPMMFVSGVFYPVETMPWIFQKIAYIFPLTHLNNAMRDIMLKGASLGDIWLEIAILLIFTLLFFIIGVKRFDRDV